MIDYDRFLEAQFGPDIDGERDDPFYCADQWCDGHAFPGQRCEP